MVSNALAGRAAGMGASAGRGAAGAERGAAGAAAVARGALGGCAGAAPGPGPAQPAGPPVGPPGGSVGSLMVGAAEGLGGKLIRTVSFLGWTLPVSFFGGTAPLGMFGMFSAIKLILLQAKVAARPCQTLIPHSPVAGESPPGRSPGPKPLPPPVHAGPASLCDPVFLTPRRLLQLAPASHRILCSVKNRPKRNLYEPSQIPRADSGRLARWSNLASVGSISASDTSNPVAASIQGLFECEDPQILKLAQDIFRQCVMAKIKPPEGTLKHRWLNSGTGDALLRTMDLGHHVHRRSLACCRAQGILIRDVFQNYWDFQERWNAQAACYARGMMGLHDRAPKHQNWVSYPGLFPNPDPRVGMERVYRRNGDKELLRQGLGPLERFHEWFWRERDVNNSGLVAVGSYSGVVQHGRFETFDNECNLDELKLTRTPSEREPVKEAGMGTSVCRVLRYLLSRNAASSGWRGAGCSAMASRRKRRIERNRQSGA